MTRAIERAAVIVESLALGLWAGAMFAFAFVFAPAAFAAIPNLTVFGALVEHIIGILGAFGLGCAAVALLAEVWRRDGLRESDRWRLIRAGLVVLATLAIMYDVRVIVPQMSATAARISGALDSVPKNDPRRAAYDDLHSQSSRAYGLAFLCVAASLATVALGRNVAPKFSESAHMRV